MRQKVTITLDAGTIKSIHKKRGLNSVSRFIENELLELWGNKK